MDSLLLLSSLLLMATGCGVFPGVSGRGIEGDGGERDGGHRDVTGAAGS